MEDTENDVIETEPTAQSAQKTDYDIFVSKMAQKLWANGQLILTGAPGTGKTYMAQKIAEKIISKKGIVSLRKSGQYKLVQFHPGYSYDDFVQRLKTIKTDDGEVKFEPQNGVFMDFCLKAGKQDPVIEDAGEAESLQDRISAEDPFSFQSLYRELVKRVRKGGLQIECIKGENDTDQIFYSPVMAQEKNREFILLPGVKIDDKIVDVKIFRGSLLSLWKKFTQYLSTPNAAGKRVDNILAGIQFEQNIGKERPKDYFAKPFKSVAKYMWKIVIARFYESLIVKDEPRKNNNFVFVIDEINRADVPRVFGEMIYGLEYREKEFETPYSHLTGELFAIPENLYVIGTMNDIGCRAESMDFDFRRRFAWQKITAEQSEWIINAIKLGKKWHDISDEDKEKIVADAKQKMRAVNKYIGPWKNEAGTEMQPEPVEVNGKMIQQDLGKEYQLGGAYFKNIEKYPDEDGQAPDWIALWDNHIEGILREYLRGRRDIEEILTALKEIYLNPENFL